MRILIASFICSLIIGLSSCSFPTPDDIVDDLKDGFWAVPILNDEIKIQDLFNYGDGNTEIYSDDKGRVIVSYEGEVLRDPANVVFPPIFGGLDIKLSDTIFQLDLSQGATENTVDSAVFLQDILHFKFVSSSTEPLTVTATIDEIVKDGKKLTQTVFFPGSPDGTEVEITAPDIDLEDWSLLGNDNKITFHYDARTVTNERVKIDGVFVFFNILQFKYLQGYFPKTNRPVLGSFIPINLYNRWIGGTMDFVEPRVEMDIENSFGFAVGTAFNEMSLESIDGDKFELESTIIDEGIIFNYPGFDELGAVKNTYFEFNKENSNIAIIFNNRIARFIYNIDAKANPLDEPDFLGYMTDESYYAVQVKVEVPMHLAINTLQLVDTFDVNFNVEKDYLDTAELKIVLENNFPIDITTQLYLVDQGNNIIDSVFQDGKVFLKGGTFQADGTLTDVEKQSYFVRFSDQKLTNLLNAKRVIAKPTFITTPNGQDHVWLYEDYGLKVKMGAKFSVE